MMERQAHPGVQQAKNFPDYIQSVGSAAPPMLRIERVKRRGADDNAAFAVSKGAPERMDAARVRLAGNNDDGAQGRRVQREFDGDDFVGGIENGRLEYVNRGARHAFVNKNLAVVVFLT